MSTGASFRFALDARDGAARAGRYETPHGVVETPTFMPVATFGAVRGVGADDLAALGARMLLANTYHLHERPGDETIAALGGLHGFTGWRGPWLTDSGGFQISSMGDRVEIDETGIAFSSPLDGRRRALTPERVVEIQQALGSDVAMVLDECQPPLTGRGPDAAPDDARAASAMERSLRWAERSRKVALDRDMALFGIVQGGVNEALRRRSARETVALGFDGYAHGGLGMGEERAQRIDMLGAVEGELPADRPRYLMGLGRPIDLLDGVAAGVDLFDCVVPTRNGRHGVLFTRAGRLNVKNARFRSDERPPEPGCDCPTCRSHSRAYVRHLLQIDEALGARLATLHNLRFYLRLLEDARHAIARGEFASLRDEVSATVDGVAD